MAAKRILVLGGGFAGLWSAVGAARHLDQLGVPSTDVEITLVNRDAYHGIRVRNYESDLADVRIPLDDVLEPIGVERIAGAVADINLAAREVLVNTAGGPQTLTYDRLVFALGSQLVRPAIPGADPHLFDVDTYDGAARLNRHLADLPAQPDLPRRFTVLVVGAGLTGIEAAAEMPGKLRAALAATGQTYPVRVILADHSPWIGSNMGEAARVVIAEALSELKIETRPGVDVVSVSASGATLKSGEEISAQTVVWCAGMRAHPLTSVFPVEHDRFGRLPVDPYLRVTGVAGVFAAGDVAAVLMDDQHVSVMSCQHGRPMGRFAGHNVVSDLFDLPMLPLTIPWYVTVLDLGPWGAVYTEGWDRHVVAKGAAAKRTKQLINCERIYPPRSRNRTEILAAAAPVVQSPPATYRERSP
jgi:NADH:ubiquinone reductase (H+-translocating)